MVSVLVAEDAPHIAEALNFLLRREGYTVTLCDDGPTALLHLDSHDILLLDIMLPGATGFEIAEAAKASANQPKICVLTAKGQAADRDKMDRIGVDAFVTKPFSNKALLETVRALANGRTA